MQFFDKKFKNFGGVGPDSMELKGELCYTSSHGRSRRHVSEEHIDILGLVSTLLIIITAY